MASGKPMLRACSETNVDSAAPLVIWRHHCYTATREAAARVRSHISPGPYRSFRELSLAGSVDPDIWCPPTFVGNSGIERFNGVCGFALFFVIPRGCGVSSTLRRVGVSTEVPKILDRPPQRPIAHKAGDDSVQRDTG